MATVSLITLNLIECTSFPLVPIIGLIALGILVNYIAKAVIRYKNEMLAIERKIVDWSITLFLLSFIPSIGLIMAIYIYGLQGIYSGISKMMSRMIFGLTKTK